MTIEHHDFERELEQQANLFASRNKTENDSGMRTYIVADLEFGRDTARYEKYCVQEGSSAERKLRWPFNRIAAASWVVMRFTPGVDAPDIDLPVVMSANNYSECEMVRALFNTLDRHQATIFTTWGGETRDLAVLRQSAAEHGLILPSQLADLSPLSLHRIDLCDAVSVRSESVHLGEYASACSIPAKPSPSKSIGKLVERGRWADVEEQCLADVLATAVILLRHLYSRGRIGGSVPEAVLQLGEAAVDTLPGSKFLRHVFRHWARAVKARSKLTGKVYHSALVECPPSADKKPEIAM